MFQYSDNSNNSDLIKNIENKYNLAINFFQSEQYKVNQKK